MEEKQNPYLVPGAIIVAGIIIAGTMFLTQKDSVLKTSDSQPPTTEALLGQGQPQGEINIDFEGWAAMGKETAPITMVEYSDFACPFCARFWEETLPFLKRDYIDTGKVRFIYKDFVVVGGDRAAEASHCAQEQGKYWEYHDLLFGRQAQDRAQWSDPQVHRGYAQELGLDAQSLVDCFNERRHQAKVQGSTQEAMQNGGQGTPYFLINKQPIFGAQPYSAFQQIIESLLTEE